MKIEDPTPASDDQSRVEERLARQVRDGPGQAALDTAKEAFGSRPANSTVAVLVSDSLATGDDPPEHHLLEFRANDAVIKVHVSGKPGARRLQIYPIRDLSSARLESPAWSPPRAADADFEFPAVPSTIVRVHLVLSCGRAVHTDWFRV